MQTKTMFIIVVIVAGIGMLGMAAIAIQSVPQAHADAGGKPDANAVERCLQQWAKNHANGGNGGEPLPGAKNPCEP